MCRPFLILTDVAARTSGADASLLCGKSDVSSCMTEPSDDHLSQDAKDSTGTEAPLLAQEWLDLGRAGSFLGCASVAHLCQADAVAAADTSSSAAIISTEVEDGHLLRSPLSNDQAVPATAAMAGLQSILDLPLPVADAPALPVQRCLFDGSSTATINDDTRGQPLSKTGGDQPSLSIQIGTPSWSIGGYAEEQVQKWLAFSEAQALLRMCVIDTPIRCDNAVCADVAVDAAALAAAPLPPPAFRMLGLPC